MNETDNTAANEQTLDDKLRDIQEYWTGKITELNKGMKDLAGIDSTLNTIYATRQDIVDYYTNMMYTLGKYSREYNKKYAEMYNNYKLGTNGIRYTSDSSIANQIEANLIEYKATVQVLHIHTEFIKETIKTLDNMIYGVTHKINTYKLMNGIKNI